MKTLIFGYGITGKAVETFFKVKSEDYEILVVVHIYYILKI